MEDTKNTDQLWFELDQKRGHYRGMSYSDYQALKSREMEIAGSSKVRLISVDDVCTDIARVGSEEAQRLPKAFFDLTQASSRRAYSFGEDHLVVYFAVGSFQAGKNQEVGLISAHIPGSSGGGGDGLNGTRRLQLVEKPILGSFQLFNLNVFDHQRWLENTLAYASEWYDGKVRYRYVEDAGGSLELVKYLKAAIEAV